MEDPRASERAAAKPTIHTAMEDKRKNPLLYIGERVATGAGSGRGAARSGDRLRIALVAPPMVPVPPRGYGGTERIVAALAEELDARRHWVTVFAAGDSDVSGELVPIIDRSLWSTGYRGDVSNYISLAAALAWEQASRFDIIHSHLETLGFLFARHCPTPVLSTLHGRLDVAGIPELLGTFPDIPLVAISESQRRWAPDQNWLATIHHGLPLASMPFGKQVGEYYALVARLTPEKGISQSIELAQRTRRQVRIAAKVHDPSERTEFDVLVRPFLDDPYVEFLGELLPTQRDPLYAGAYATLMLGGWPEPFGLTAIESMAAGTPVIARRAGALPEIIEHGVDGFLVDDVAEAELAASLIPSLDRAAIRERALRRFSVERMVDEYEAAYRLLLERTAGTGRGSATIGRALVGMEPAARN